MNRHMLNSHVFADACWLPKTMFCHHGSAAIRIAEEGNALQRFTHHGSAASSIAEQINVCNVLGSLKLKCTKRFVSGKWRRSPQKTPEVEIYIYICFQKTTGRTLLQRWALLGLRSRGIFLENVGLARHARENYHIPRNLLQSSSSFLCLLDFSDMGLRADWLFQ